MAVWGQVLEQSKAVRAGALTWGGWRCSLCPLPDSGLSFPWRSPGVCAGVAVWSCGVGGPAMSSVSRGRSQAAGAAWGVGTPEAPVPALAWHRGVPEPHPAPPPH